MRPVYSPVSGGGSYGAGSVGGGSAAIAAASGVAVALARPCRAASCAISRRRRLSRSARQREPLAPRAVGAAHRRAPVEGPGRPPALARAVDERRRALAMVDDAADGRVEPGATPAAPARSPRSTSSPYMCSAGSNGPSRRSTAVGRGDAGAGEPGDRGPGARAGRARCARAAPRAAAPPGTRARTHGQSPTSGPLADGWTVPSGFSTRGPTRPAELGGRGRRAGRARRRAARCRG